MEKQCWNLDQQWLNDGQVKGCYPNKIFDAALSENVGLEAVCHIFIEMALENPPDRFRGYVFAKISQGGCCLEGLGIGKHAAQCFLQGMPE